MLGFFYRKGEIFTSPKRNERPTDLVNHDAKINILRQFCKMQPHDLIHNVGWGLIVENSKYVIHVVHSFIVYVCGSSRTTKAAPRGISLLINHPQGRLYPRL